MVLLRGDLHESSVTAVGHFANISGVILPFMDFSILVEQAVLILDQERLTPTLGYNYVGKTMPFRSELLRCSARRPFARDYGDLRTTKHGKQRPRSVWEKPGEWEFTSRNYGLLMLILQQIDDSQRHIFIHKLIESQLALGNGKRLESFSRERFRSGLPLVAEFCVRNGYLSSLMGMSSQLVYPDANMAVVTVQMEEIIALNFDVFKKSELEAMPPSSRKYGKLQKRKHGKRVTRAASRTTNLIQSLSPDLALWVTNWLRA